MRFNQSNEGNFTLTYKVATLVAALEKNRAKHAGNFAKAMEGYTVKYKAEIERALAHIAKGEPFHHGSRLTKPNGYVQEYDRALDMLKHTTAKTIPLSAELFNQLVRDEWGWSQEFASNSMSYVP